MVKLTVKQVGRNEDEEMLAVLLDIAAPVVEEAMGIEDGLLAKGSVALRTEGIGIQEPVLMATPDGGRVIMLGDGCSAHIGPEAGAEWLLLVA
jgi:hypothetical protein